MKHTCNVFLFHQAKNAAKNNHILCESVIMLLEGHDMEAKIIGSAEEVAVALADLVDAISQKAGLESVAMKQLLVSLFVHFIGAWVN